MEGGCSLRASVGSGNDPPSAEPALDACDDAAGAGEGCMRVVIVTGIYPPDIGGPATHASDLRDALLERGHRVVVLTLGEAADVTREPGLVRWPRSWPWPRRHAATFAGSLRTRRIDAIYAMGMTPPPWQALAWRGCDRW